jgi:hypothetical protein
MPAAAIWECVSDDWSGKLGKIGATDPCEGWPARVDAGIHRGSHSVECGGGSVVKTHGSGPNEK